MVGGILSIWRLAALVAVFGLAACAEKELILPGEREPIRGEAVASIDALLEGEPAEGEEEAEVELLPTPVVLPAAQANTNWTHKQGNADHLIGHVALGATLSRIWTADAGQGNAKRARMTGAPVVADGRVFATDAGARLSAFDLNGRALWSIDLTPEDERSAPGTGGGASYADGKLYASTGYGEVLAIDPATGAVLWRRLLDAAIEAAPTIDGDRVVVVTRADVAYGLDADTGEAVWRVQGVGLGAGVVGGASPAIRGPVTVIPYRSGEVVAALTRSGRRVWSAAISGGRRGLVRATISDISGDPVIDNDLVYAANQAGRLVAIDRRSGERLWTAQEGALGPVVPVTDALFLVSDAGEVLRLDAASGEVIWRAALPIWENPKKRKAAIAHFGPVLAGGRLLVASSDGQLRSFDPTSGVQGTAVSVPGGAASAPAVAGSVLYVLSQSGDLHAFQ